MLRQRRLSPWWLVTATVELASGGAGMKGESQTADGQENVASKAAAVSFGGRTASA